MDEVRYVHSVQKPALLMNRNRSIILEPEFIECVLEITQFFPLIISSFDQEKDLPEYSIPCNHDTIPSAIPTKYILWTCPIT